MRDLIPFAIKVALISALVLGYRGCFPRKVEQIVIEREIPAPSKTVEISDVPTDQVPSLIHPEIEVDPYEPARVTGWARRGREVRVSFADGTTRSNEDGTILYQGQHYVVLSDVGWQWIRPKRIEDTDTTSIQELDATRIRLLDTPSIEEPDTMRNYELDTDEETTEKTI